MIIPLLRHFEIEMNYNGGCFLLLISLWSSTGKLVLGSENSCKIDSFLSLIWVTHKQVYCICSQSPLEVHQNLKKDFIIG